MNQKQIAYNPITRVRIWYGLLLVVLAVFGVRLFYLQIIRHDYYKKSALSGQLKQYEIPAVRGVIEAHDSEEVVPIVLNEKRYTLFADPKYIKDPAGAAAKVQKVIGGKQEDLEAKMRQKTRYAILAKKLEKAQQEKLDALEIKGVGTREESIRTYPQGSLAAQLLGFVDDEGAGRYGLEQALNGTLKGKAGQLRAITDAAGVPLVANRDNIVNQPQTGDRVLLTIDVSMQRQLEDILKEGLDKARSKSGSALIMDPNTGAIKAMANYPTYNPAEFYKVENGEVFNNAAASSPLEVGSIMKPLTAAAALDRGVVSASTTYYDPAQIKVGDATITNVEEDGGAATRSVADILQLSLNTGATWLLMQMGGGEINQKARETWHNYMTEHYRFGKPTGIEQGYEAGGSIPDPNDGFGLNIQFANTTFGQGMTATPLQMGAALSGAINGGTYYQPHLVEQVTNAKGKVTKTQPKKLTTVVGEKTSRELRQLMQHVIAKNHHLYGLPAPTDQYQIGGKTGTAEVPKPGGGYYTDRYNGTFMGFVGGDKPEYVIVVRVNEPIVKGYAGTTAAAPIFTGLTNMLINNFNVTPRGQ
ncbi:penicillin-binding protein 2 [Candidatus Saccharibacteria bacterium]|nr:MAG: penicillin-binding protein 2 [Candidatus Saccharibacteria bacterium]